MNDKYEKEISANIKRAEESIAASGKLVEEGYFDFAASRAYYAAFYAVTASLLSEGAEFSKHSGVISAFHTKFIKTGKLDAKFGRDLRWLFELRGVGDYGQTEHVSKENAGKAIETAESLLQTIKKLI